MSSIISDSSSIFYPESDGKPKADNSRQFRWITMLYDNLAALFQTRADVFVCGNQNWYPVEGEPTIVAAPDVYVVFGRPKGDRGSYKQWEEADIPMTVVFEVLSPSNDYDEMDSKQSFYEEYGVEEYYVYDPDKNKLRIFVRRGEVLTRVRKIEEFVSPRLGIRFEMTSPEMTVFFSDGTPFLSFEQLVLARKQDRQRAEQAELHAKKLAQEMRRLVELTQKSRTGALTVEEQAELSQLEGPC